jgi:hypothetical protein
MDYSFVVIQNENCINSYIWTSVNFAGSQLLDIRMLNYLIGGSWLLVVSKYFFTKLTKHWTWQLNGHVHVVLIPNAKLCCTRVFVITTRCNNKQFCYGMNNKGFFSMYQIIKHGLKYLLQRCCLQETKINNIHLFLKDITYFTSSHMMILCRMIRLFA